MRSLVRIGLDRVVATATPEAFEAYVRDGGASSSIPVVGFDALANRSDAVVVDVRRQPEVEAGHVPGALWIPHTCLAARLDEIPRDRPLLVHCQSGVRAAVASAFLASRGYDVTYVNDTFARYRTSGAVETGTTADLAV